MLSDWDDGSLTRGGRWWARCGGEVEEEVRGDSIVRGVVSECRSCQDYALYDSIKLRDPSGDQDPHRGEAWELYSKRNPDP